MAKVRRSAYRQPVTPMGLRKIERGELKWFDPEMFSNFNTGTLEQYLDEKNRKESFARSQFSWKVVFSGILIGVLFALINQYIGLKIGLITSGSIYVTYLMGLAMRWSPTQINIAAGGASGADKTCTGFVFTFPSIFLLAYSARYAGVGGSRLVSESDISMLLPIALVSAIFAAFMGVMYFIIFRRIWLVEDPLPTPGFEAQIKLLDIANDISRGAAEHARHAIKLVRNVTLSIMFLAFLRDFPIVNRRSIIDSMFANEYYSGGSIHMSYEQSTYTHVGLALQGIGLAIGWFMKFRVAFIVTVGCLFTWLVVIPMIVGIGVPIYVPLIDGYVHPLDFPVLYIGEEGTPELLLGARSPAHAADLGVAKVIAIGAILGGGITGLLKMIPTFKTVTADIGKTRGGKRKDWVPKKGWYEWPVTHIKIMMIVAGIGIGTVFWVGGFPIVASFVFSGLLVGITFILGAIAVKVGGEVGTTPVSGTSFICLLLLIGVFSLINVAIPFKSPSQLLVMALVGTAVFGSAISLSADIVWEFKVGIYSGTRPFHIMRSELTGIMFGAFVSVTAAVFFSTMLATGKLDLEAPQAHAFATFAQIMMGGNVMLPVFALGIGIGVFIELLTGLGTAFGLGMYLPLSYTLTLLIGGGARDFWEKKWLEPRAKAEGWTEREKTFRLLDSFMVATGLLVGEALLGTLLAFYLFFA
ncbi:MAG: OPT/YSL family transporter [Thermoplasmata archaeon]|nr:OPT/YSL family transporter [Thermoplasmata archaeon]